MSGFRSFYDASFSVIDVESFISGPGPEWAKYETRERLRASISAVMHLTSGNDGTRILDLGCGDGVALRSLRSSSPGQQFVGADISMVALRKARSSGTDALLVVCDSNHLPFREGSFDVVLCTEVIEHVLEPEELLGEIARVARGYMVLTTPCFGPWSSVRYNLWASRWNSYIRAVASGEGITAMLEKTPRLAGSSVHTGHVNVFTIRALRGHLGRHFRVVREAGIFFNLPYLPRLLERWPRLELIHALLQSVLLQRVPLYCTFSGGGAIGNFEVLVVGAKV